MVTVNPEGHLELECADTPEFWHQVLCGVLYRCLGDIENWKNRRRDWGAKKFRCLTGPKVEPIDRTFRDHDPDGEELHYAARELDGLINTVFQMDSNIPAFHAIANVLEQNDVDEAAESMREIVGKYAFRKTPYDNTELETPEGFLRVFDVQTMSMLQQLRDQPKHN